MKNLLTSRAFWGALFMVVVAIITSFIPNFKLDVEHGTSLAVLAVSYIVGVAVDPGAPGWKGVVQSRKFWGAVIGLTVVFLDAFQIVLPFQLTVEQLALIVASIGAFIANAAIEGQTRPYKGN